MSMSPKENLLNLSANGPQGPLLVEWEAFTGIFNDPVNQYLRAHRQEGQTTTDLFGTQFHWPEGQISATPHITKDNKAMPDITKWRETLKVPDLRANAVDWTEARAAKAAIDAEGQKLSFVLMATGLFEQLHFLMGFEDTLMNLIRKPKDIMELCEVLGEYRLTFAKLIVENLKPDVILSHDDWGTKTQLFMRPEQFRKYLRIH